MMTEPTTTPADPASFIEERLDEDEAMARAASAGEWLPRQDDMQANVETLDDGEWSLVVGIVSFADADHIARYDPARVLREVEAKRLILAQHRHRQADYCSFGCDLCHFHSEYGMPPGVNWCETVRALASVWPDHPDYQTEWAPSGD
jgi:hypothetical protein